MLTAHASGRLLADPQRRSTSGGKPFTMARLLCAQEGNDAQVVTLFAFGSTGDTLAALAKGDSLSVVGRLRLSTWNNREGTPQPGAAITVDLLQTPYDVRRKRAATTNNTDADRVPRPAEKSADHASERALAEAGQLWRR